MLPVYDIILFLRYLVWLAHKLKDYCFALASFMDVFLTQDTFLLLGLLTHSFTTQYSLMIILSYLKLIHYVVSLSKLNCNKQLQTSIKRWSKKKMKK